MSKRKGSGLRFLLVLGVVVYFMYIILDQQKVMGVKGKELEDITNKTSKELQVNSDLKKQKETINTDEYTEKIAREKLGMVKQGEKVFVDIDK